MEIECEGSKRKAYWSDSVAVGTQDYVAAMQSQLGVRANGRQCVVDDKQFILKEPDVPYNLLFTPKKGALSD